MRALIILPLNESSEHIAMGLMTGLDKQGFNALSIPNYADYLTSVHLAKNFEQSIFMALTTAKDFAVDMPNAIVIGNCDKSIKFDVIINVNIYHEEGEPLPDLQVAQLQERYGDDPDLGPIINHLYTTDDGEYTAGGTVEQIVELVTNLCKTKLN